MKFNGVSLVELGSKGSSRVPCEAQRRFAVADQPPGWSAFVQDWQLVDDMAGRPTLGRHKSNQRSPRGPCLARCGSLWPQDERKQENETGLPDGPLSVYALTASPLLSGRVPTMTNKQPGQQQPRRSICIYIYIYIYIYDMYAHTETCTDTPTKTHQGVATDSDILLPNPAS